MASAGEIGNQRGTLPPPTRNPGYADVEEPKDFGSGEMHLVALGSGVRDDGCQGIDAQAHGQRLPLGGVEVMFEAEHLLTHDDDDVGRSSRSNTTDAESACAFNL